MLEGIVYCVDTCMCSCTRHKWRSRLFRRLCAQYYLGFLLFFSLFDLAVGPSFTSCIEPVMQARRNQNRVGSRKASQGAALVLKERGVPGNPEEHEN